MRGFQAMEVCKHASDIAKVLGTLLTLGHFCPSFHLMKAREFIHRLKKNGVEVIEGRGKGGHVLARYQGKQATIPIHGSKDIDPSFLKSICKQIGIDHNEIL